jgi:hypothetical protein
MTLPAFTIDLGNGLHLDGTGALTGAIDGKASFTLSAPLTIPGAALQQAFSGLKTVIPKLDDIAKDIGLLDQFKSFGLSEQVISTSARSHRSRRRWRGEIRASPDRELRQMTRIGEESLTEATS